jgi:hypothetical protein
MIPYNDRIEIAKEKQVSYTKDNHHFILLKADHSIIIEFIDIANRKIHESIINYTLMLGTICYHQYITIPFYRLILLHR